MTDFPFHDPITQPKSPQNRPFRINHCPLNCPGFTLIELLIFLTCMGILLAWGVPNYQSLLQRNQRTQARTALLQAALWMERSASANGSYPMAQSVPSGILSTPDLLYRLSITSTASSYTLQVTPLGAQTADACGTLTLNHMGTRDVKNASETANNCWQR